MVKEIKFPHEFALVGTTTEEQRQKLLEAAFGPGAAGPRTKVQWKGQGSLVEISGIGYNRAWLIVERRSMELYEPQALVSLPAAVAAAHAEWKRLPAEDREANPFDPEMVQADIVRAMLLDEHGSWGRVMVRTNENEDRCRKLFKYGNRVQDIGLRPAQKGGRFLQDQGELYTEYRRKEGAAIAPTTTRTEVHDRGVDALENKGERKLRDIIPTAKLAEYNKAMEASRAARKAARDAKRQAAKLAKEAMAGANEVVALEAAIEAPAETPAAE